MSLTKLRKNAPYILPDWKVSADVVALTTTRQTGYSEGNYKGFNIAAHVEDVPEHVMQNRKYLIELLDDEVDLQWLEQIHGTDVVEAQYGSGVLRGDAVYTRCPGIACCIATADCLPVLLTNNAGNMVAAAHAGWRGLANGVLEQTVASFACPVEDIVAWLGPAIGPCHFQVGAEVRDAYLTDVEGNTRAMIEDCFRPSETPGKLMANLYQIATVKLKHLGVTSVSGGGFCTYCQADSFFSYRRQGKTGRMVSLIYLKSS